MSADPDAAPAAASFPGPDAVPPRATVIVVPGRGEQPGVYARFGARLAGDAYPVRVVVDPTAHEEVARAQLAAVLAAAPRTAPVALAGSDTGALFAARLLADGDAPGVDGLILAGLPSPGTDPAGDRSWQQELDARSSCPSHRARIGAGELVSPGALYQPIPEGWVDDDVLRAIEAPILGVHGAEDPISPLPWAREAYARAPRAELVSIAGSPHDVLNDQTHRTVAAVAVLWLERLRAGNGLAPLATLEPGGVGVVA